MNNATELLRRALAALDTTNSVLIGKSLLREQIQDFLATQPEAEPVAFINLDEKRLEWAVPFEFKSSCFVLGKLPLYLHPPRPAEQEAEPVGYAVKMIPRGLHFIGFVGEEETEEEIEDYGPDQIVLLYTRPEPARKPMTEEEIEAACPYTDEDFMGGFFEGVRFAEKHHGITNADV